MTLSTVSTRKPERLLPNSFYEDNIKLMPQTDVVFEERKTIVDESHEHRRKKPSVKYLQIESKKICKEKLYYSQIKLIPHSKAGSAFENQCNLPH